jgi:hypothetical protein
MLRYYFKGGFMAKIGVTYEQVALACQSLLKEGQSPNFRNVMAKTGGAAKKVSEYLNTWRNEQENIVLAALDEELCAVAQSI